MGNIIIQNRNKHNLPTVLKHKRSLTAVHRLSLLNLKEKDSFRRVQTGQSGYLDILEEISKS